MDITGTALDDRLDGTVDADTIQGLEGHDLISGGNGDDTVDGGDGSDYIQSGDGSDTVRGGDGDDSIDDIGGGSDTLIGGAGDDSIRLRHSSWSQPVAETIRIDAGDGNDRVDYSSMHFYLASSTATIDLGAGDDRLTLETDYRDTVRVSLGTGRDTVVLSENGYFPNAVVVADFAAGGTGDAIDFNAWITAKLYGWDGSNPFGASGHLRLVQTGADAVLEIDGDGPNGPYSSWRPLFRFENTTASAFTAANLGGWRPDGAAPPATSITGTDLYEVIKGTIGNDTIRGLGERDEIDGGAGNDTIYGGAGNDSVHGGAGSDFVDGGDGDDYVSGGGGSDTLIGGRGNDMVSFSTSNVIPSVQTVRIDAGVGDDQVTFANDGYVSAGSLATIALGDGNDRLLLQSAAGPTRVTLGRGRDTVVLTEQTRRVDAPEFTDFVPGAAGDVFELAELFQRLGYWDGGNPFGASGHARLVRAGPDTLLQLDPTGAAVDHSRFETRAVLRNVDAAALTAANFAGFAPRIVGLAEAATVSVAAPEAIAEDGGQALSLNLTFSNVSQARGTVTLSFAAAGSTATDRTDVTVPSYSEEYAIPPASVQYTFALPTIAILADSLVEGTETIAVTIRASGQMFDTGTDTKTVTIKLVDSGQTGGMGADTLTGTRFKDDLTGAAGDDRLIGGLGDDRLDGGAGQDTAVFAGGFRQSSVGTASGVTTVAGPEGVDTGVGVEQYRFADGVLVIDPDGAGAQVQRLYAAVLDRSADQAGLESWLDRMHDDGWTLDRVADAFLRSPEFQASGANVAGNAAFVDFLYRRVLDRAADAAGRADWIARLDAGLARSDALLFFSESGEHKAQTASMTAGGWFETDDAYQTVALLYDSFAGRRPDAAGLIGWAEALKGGTMTLSQVAAGFAASDEFRTRTAGLDRGQLVDFMYQNTLDRPPDAPGRAHWIAQLDGGLSTGDMLLLFATSTEHQYLYSAYITGGIDVL
ncbi:DUF4214 domain-containing protein [Sphingomonas sp.]|jgi:Ca2+-binding RTX toxin-like protein|uniref:DUF4214 domain-containing protein n=1 Tax=Sphingomonas sp. TaxID=28214 RepID=UPI002D7FA95C|nr:DUF4214 domain-containing protein [Sphingomonas sp.]HEU0043135.1 DUF4214 domain-containing protein [Sphingomonas sp.]